MVDIPSMSQISDRFDRGLGGARQNYEQGIARRDDNFWQSQTEAASDAWESGVQEAINQGTFANGVNNPSRSWSERAANVGAQRLTQDTEGAANAYASGFAPFRDTIEQQDLPPRGRRGDPANYDRSQELGQALHQLSLEQ